MVAPGDKVRITADGEEACAGIYKAGSIQTVTRVNEYCPTYVNLNGDNENLFVPANYETVLREGESMVPITRKYVDTIHFKPLEDIRNAFVIFNDALLNAGDSIGCALEVPDVTVKIEGTEDYARVFFMDGEVFVEPLFDLVRDMEDR